MLVSLSTRLPGTQATPPNAAAIQRDILDEEEEHVGVPVTESPSAVEMLERQEEEEEVSDNGWETMTDEELASDQQHVRNERTLAMSDAQEVHVLKNVVAAQLANVKKEEAVVKNATAGKVARRAANAAINAMEAAVGYEEQVEANEMLNEESMERDMLEYEEDEQQREEAEQGAEYNGEQAELVQQMDETFVQV